LGNITGFKKLENLIERKRKEKKRKEGKKRKEKKERKKRKEGFIAFKLEIIIASLIKEKEKT